MQIHHQLDEDHWDQPLPPLQVMDEDDGFCECPEFGIENWDDDDEV